VLKPGDILLTQGAGDIGKIASQIAKYDFGSIIEKGDQI